MTRYRSINRGFITVVSHLRSRPLLAYARGLLVFSLYAASNAGAMEIAGVDLTGSGFMTLAAGKILSGDTPSNFNGYHGPVYIADYGQAGVYEKDRGWDVWPDSKLGLQGVATFNPQWSITGQAVVRGATRAGTDLEWLYLTHKINDKFSLQVGRKRLPLFYYSESQDVGLSMPWVRLPPQTYGWDVVNFNGATLIYREQLAGWNSAAEIYAGSETRSNNPYLRLYYGKNAKMNERWSQILGADWSVSRDWLELRFSYLQSKWNYAGDSLAGFIDWPASRQKFYAAAFNVDYQNWLIVGEIAYIDRRSAYENDYSQMIGIGKRIGKWQPMLTYANFSGHFLPGPVYSGSDNESHSTVAFTLRYDLTPSSDVKAQLEKWQDKNGPGFNGVTGNPVSQGNPTLLSISYDRVF